MKKYYLHDGTAQVGPFDLEELIINKMTLSTPVWYEGLAEWTPAENIEEFKYLFKTVNPPPFNAQKSPPPFEGNLTTGAKTLATKTFSKHLILKGILIVGLTGGGFLVYSNMTANRSASISKESYEEKVISVEEMEHSQPTTFLTADGTYNENFWGDKLKIRGVIKSTATVAIFKDVVVEITYYSNTGSVLQSESYTIYEYIMPNSEKKFELKINHYKGTKRVGLQVVEAIPS